MQFFLPQLYDIYNGDDDFCICPIHMIFQRFLGHYRCKRTSLIIRLLTGIKDLIQQTFIEQLWCATHHPGAVMDTDE